MVDWNSDATEKEYPTESKAENSLRPKAILRTAEVLQLVGISRTTLWRRIKAQEFPAAVRLGPEGSRAIGWRWEQVEQWLRSRPEA